MKAIFFLKELTEKNFGFRSNELELPHLFFFWVGKMKGDVYKPRGQIRGRGKLKNRIFTVIK